MGHNGIAQKKLIWNVKFVFIIIVSEAAATERIGLDYNDDDVENEVAGEDFIMS